MVKLKKVKDPGQITLCHYTIPVFWKRKEEVNIQEDVEIEGHHVSYDHGCWGVTTRQEDGSVDIVMRKDLCGRMKVETFLHEAFHAWKHVRDLHNTEWTEELCADESSAMFTAIITQNPKLLKWIEYNLQ